MENFENLPFDEPNEFEDLPKISLEQEALDLQTQEEEFERLENITTILAMGTAFCALLVLASLIFWL